ncbi:tannase and feruloyl esterase [Exidia glandulosa HHB12029]|uniref:Carboxylic ester hydrolase n=1 Tax=Exidia glandulosa HHB12029 TaxID=1314781 RepID=A0A165ICU4_EXIGL|nr:tannase and feruloyl esterase [Exidia glandulosa HHB12029]
MSGARLPQVFLKLLGLVAPAVALTDAQRCVRLADTYIKNVHSLDTLYLPANESYRVPASCGMGLGDDLLAQTSVNVCVVNVICNTSSTSATRIEVWLPDADAWYGRILGTGGGGLGGCVDYDNLKYGPSVHFATFGHDGGHDGTSGAAFAKSDEIVVDYATRGLHVAAVTSKLLVRAYYGRPQDKAYYNGCSNGGRQGMRNAQDFPDDFDGILAGAPAFNFINLLAQSNIANLASHKLSDDDWALVRTEVLRQCDGLDGLHDEIVSDPDACQFLPEALLCEGEKRPDCLSLEQVEAVRTIHSPLYGDHGELLAPRLDPGAELDTLFWPLIFGPSFYLFGHEWWQYVVYNDSSWEPSPDFGLKEIADAKKRDAQLPVDSFSPDLSAFRKRGGKLLTYHGSRDILIPSGTSLWYYQRVQRALSLPPSAMDEFYRLFLVPGMSHCYMGAAASAWQIGQIGFSVWSNSSDSHALFALVDWVEKGSAPETLRGSTSVSVNTTVATPSTRRHCKYPARSVWKPDVQDWSCVQFP